MKADKRYNITTNLAYLAGFFDGEGCIRIKKSYNGSKACWVTVQISNTDRTILEEYKRLFGGEVHTRGKSKNFQCYMYELSSSEAVDFLKTMVGHLRGKKAQAIYAIAFHEELPNLSREERLERHDKLRAMKLEVIGNVYENPELINESN